MSRLWVGATVRRLALMLIGSRFLCLLDYFGERSPCVIERQLVEEMRSVGWSATRAHCSPPFAEVVAWADLSRLSPWQLDGNGWHYPSLPATGAFAATGKL